MKISVYATEDGFGLDSSFNVFSKINIAEQLEISIDLLPINKTEFLDQPRKLFLKKSENDIPEN